MKMPNYMECKVVPDPENMTKKVSEMRMSVKVKWWGWPILIAKALLRRV